MRSNCLIYALREWWRKAEPGHEIYLYMCIFGSWLCFRRSRIRWGVFHALAGRMNWETGHIEVKSFKPPSGHVKYGVAPFFDGEVVAGDLPDHMRYPP